MIVQFPIAITQGNDEEAWGVTFPDIPGCFSAGDSLKEAIDNAREALEGHLEVLAESHEELPMAGKVGLHMENPEYVGCVWAAIVVDLNPYLGVSKKLKIVLPRSLVGEIDEYVATHPGMNTRSEFIKAASLLMLANSKK